MCVGKCFVQSREMKVGAKARLVGLIRRRWGCGLLGERPSDWGSLGGKEGRERKGGGNGSVGVRQPSSRG